jgi:hypothetical protein
LKASTDKEPTTPLKPLFYISLTVIFVWLSAAFCIYFALDNWEQRGQFGDLFGAANALFSGLAFASLIYTIHLQRQELSLQRKELELTRIELSRSASAQESSEKALAKQAEALETAARLNALSSVIEHYSIKIRSLTSASKQGDAIKEQLKYINDLEDLLNKIQKT